jgi:hypothetical protein
MMREQILQDVRKTLGAVPDWISSFPDPQLEHMWGMLSWVLSDTALSSREKALVAFGAASAVHCPY